MKKSVTSICLVVILFIAPRYSGYAEDQQIAAPSNAGVANVRDFGAKGDGKTDDTEAIEKAWAYVLNPTKATFFWKQKLPTVNTALYFPPGVYRYLGKGLTTGGAKNAPQTWDVRGDGVNSVRIMVESDAYFITCERVQSTLIEGISFVGGKGVFKSTWKGNMVGGKHIFRNCYFFDYTECAIGNNACDSPYLVVEDCIFHCRDGARAIGITWGGYVDDSQITRCDFEQNAYHIKVGNRLSGSFQIGPRNMFLSFNGTKTEADIWIVPNSEGNRGINSGQGSMICENKFGNENLDLASPRILVAAEDETQEGDRLTRKPDMKPCGEDRQVIGFKLRDNLFMGKQGMMHGIVYSYVPHTAITFDHNCLVGGAYPYMIEFDPGIRRLPDRPPGNTTYFYPQERDGVERDLFPTESSNLPGYSIVMDPYGNFAGQNEAPSSWPLKHDPSYTPIIALAGLNAPRSGNVSATPTLDPRGEKTAVALHLDDPAGRIEIKTDEKHPLVEGRVGFIDVELKASESSSLDFVHIMLLNKAHPSEAVAQSAEKAHAFLGDKTLLNQKAFSRMVKLQPYWQRITLPFVLRNTEGADYYLVIRPYGYEPSQQFIKGKKDSFVCGEIRLYHAKVPSDGYCEGVRTVEDADLVLRSGIDPEQVVYTGTLSAERTVRFVQPGPLIQPMPSSRFRITRLAAGKAPLNIEGSGSLGANEWCDVAFVQNTFRIVARGKL